MCVRASNGCSRWAAGRLVSNPGAIDVTVRNGRVRLAGHIVAGDHARRLSTVAAMRSDVVAGPHERERPDNEGHDAAPGVKGVYRMLHDEELWHALGPVVDAVKTFTQQLDRDILNPISDYSGKKGGT